MDAMSLANLLFPDITETPEELREQYPKRSLPEGAKVTRFAPSPTGFMHIGNLFGALIDERLARQSGGVFYLRIEDTDLKRMVEGGTRDIIKALSGFNLEFDEGAMPDGIPERGNYGPYRQRQRAKLYHVFAKRLVEQGLAYPCFCTPGELEAMRLNQEALKENFGYYGKWAVHRDLPFEEAAARIKAGDSYVLRLRSPGDPEKRIQVEDLVRGTLSMPENDQDIVLLKSDGIPTYHFAHVVDDTLMGTTHVVRGEEWLATLPVHIQLFSVLKLRPPKYLHTPTIMKLDGSSKRKLSKRKDPEAALAYYHREGYLPDAVLEYLMTVLNSNFEDWRKANPNLSFREFPFSPKKMSQSGALFDLQKLNDVSKTLVSRLDANRVLEGILSWAQEYEPDFYELLNADRAYAHRILSIDRGGEKPRKDLAKWSDAKDYMSYFYEATFAPDYTLPENLSPADAAAVLTAYSGIYSKADDKTAWFQRIRELGQAQGFCPDVKAYKKDPGGWKGHVGDVSTILRVAVTGRRNSPDLYEIMQVLEDGTLLMRLQAAAEYYGKEA